ncbi:MAG: MFS transporter [Endomicrobiales bacterium]|jgi:MFS family permease
MKTENNNNKRFHYAEALKVSDIRLFIGSVGFFSLAGRALAVVIGFQIYRMTHTALSLGWLGFVEAIPAISIAPFGGHIADHFNRRNILLITRSISVLSAVVLALLSWNHTTVSLAGLYAMIFLAGIARGFADPANTAFEAQVVPKHLTVNASSWISSTWISCAVIGPAIIGFCFDFYGAALSYLIISGFYVCSWILTALIPPKPQPMPEKREPVFQSILIGWRYLFKKQALWASMSLDMFAVFFGGAVALLPIYANDILKVGAKGLGLLNAAPSLGSLIMMIVATKHPPINRAGRNLIATVSGFGICIIVFAFSRNFCLSMAALFLSGAFDGISVIIRRSIIRLLSPDVMRGRIASASSIFIVASNELGAFESGMGAAWLGAVPCVMLGGIVTLGIATTVSLFAKELKNLKFNPHSLEQIHEPVLSEENK